MVTLSEEQTFLLKPTESDIEQIYQTRRWGFNDQETTSHGFKRSSAAEASFQEKKNTKGAYNKVRALLAKLVVL